MENLFIFVGFGVRDGLGRRREMWWWWWEIRLKKFSRLDDIEV